MGKHSEQKRAYRDHPPQAGIFQVKNLATGKIFLGRALNVRGKLNGVRFSLQQKSYIHAALQADWNRFGPEAFTFEVMDVLAPASGDTAVDPEELRALEALWLEKLQPYGERGYHKPPAAGPKR